MSSFPNPDPKEVDYFGYGKKAVDDPNKMQTAEELLVKFHGLLTEINNAGRELETMSGAFTIDNLADLYSRYVAFFDEVLRNSKFAAQLAEGVSYNPYPEQPDFNSLIEEQFRIHGVEDEDHDYDADEIDPYAEEGEERKIKLPEEWNKQKDLIRNMTNALGLFNYMLFENSQALDMPDSGQKLGKPWSAAHASENRRAWHPKMKAAYDALNRPVFGQLNEQIWDHLLLMGKFLRGTAPASAGAWQGGVLQGNEAFDATFQRFRALGNKRPTTDVERTRLLRSSAWLLREACADLQLDPKAVDIEWEKLVDPLQAPAYTRQSVTSRAFTFGTEEGEGGRRRPGILQVKRALGYDPATDPAVDADGNPVAPAAWAVQANTSKRRKDGGGEAGPPAKRRHTRAAAQQQKQQQQEQQQQPQQPQQQQQQQQQQQKQPANPPDAGGHAQRTWTLADADADFQWIESWLHANTRGVNNYQAPRLDGTTVLKPLLDKPTSTRWFKDFQPMARELKNLRDRVLAAPATEEEEGGDRPLLDELEEVIAEARGQRNEHSRWLHVYSRKFRRVYAIKACYLRALAVRRAAQLAEAEAEAGSGRPWSLRRDMDEHRARRLEDWVAHEGAWLGAEDFRISTAKRRVPQWQHDRLDVFERNMDAWTAEIAVLRARVAARQGEAGVDQPQQPVQPVEQPAVQEEAEAEEEVAVAQEEAVPAVEAAPAAEEAQLPQLSDWDRTILKEYYGETIFRGARLYHGKRWRDGAIYNRNETDTRRPGDGVDVFRAGGPPGYEGLPTWTTWEKLQYMIVLTHWRFQRAWEIQL